MKSRALLLAVIAATGWCRAQADPAPYRAKADDVAKKTTQLQATARLRIGEVRTSIGDANNKVHGDLDEVESKVGGLEFEGALGALAIAETHLEYVAEPARPAVQSGLAALRKLLKEAERAKAQQDCLQLLGDRIEHLQRLVTDQSDLSSHLRDLDETVVLARRSGALSRPELVALRVHLAGHHHAVDKRRTEELRERATSELSQLEAEFPVIQKGFGAGGSERDSAFGRLDQMAASISEAVAQLPEQLPAAKELRARFTKLDTPARDAFAVAYAAGIAERVKGNFDFQAFEFEGWKTESGTVTAEEYLKIDCTVPLLAHPRTAALVNRATLWLAFVDADAEFQRAAHDPKLRALRDAIQKDRDTAVARLIVSADALVAGIEKHGIADAIPRDRAVVLADCDLRLTLQEHPRQWELVARLNALTDAFDRKSLGDAKATQKIKEDAVTAAEANWSRMLQTLPMAGSFAGDRVGLSRGKYLKLPVRQNHVDEFAQADFDCVFQMDGQLLAARYDPAVKAALATASKRTGTSLSDQDECELIVVIGSEGTLSLTAADGKSAGATVPCHTMRIAGVRAGPIAFLTR